MKNGEADVRTKGKILEEKAVFEIFDSVAEALETKGEETCLSLINRQNATDAKNAIRSKYATPKASKRALRADAMALLTGDEWASAAGNKEALESLIDSKVDELVAQLKSETSSDATTAEASDEDDED